jgi:hypothetical protein
MNEIHLDDIRQHIPHWFGLGFIQLKLDDAQRLHFYHPELLADIPEEELHDHRYTFKSEILHGVFVHEEYHFVSGEGDHELVEVSCRPGSDVEPRLLDRGQAVAAGRYTMVAGSEYVFPVGGFHRVSTREAITRITRQPTVKDFAQVIRPINAPTVCPFARTIPEAQLWEYIEDLLLVRSNVGTLNQL